MDLNQLRDHMDDRFDKLSNQLTDHLQRTSRLESSVKWLATLVVLIIGGMVSRFTS